MSRRESRRRFLGQALGAVTVPWLVPSSIFGQQNRSAPSERLTVGVIGVGNMGSGHVGGFLGHPEIQLVAICDVNRSKRESQKARAEKHYGTANRSGKFSGVTVYNEYEELLARPDIDAVLIAVPDHWHAGVAIAACRAGKDVYCEKPLALTVHDARAMVAAARRYGTVFQTGSQQRSSSEFRFACEMVQSGRIGEIEKIHVNIGLPSTDKQFAPEPVPAELDWDRWLGPAPWSPYNAERCSGNYSGGWRFVRDYSGGMTTDWGAHHFDIVQWAMGADRSGPVRFEPPAHDGSHSLRFTYANGVTVERTEANGIHFFGSEGQIEVNRGYLRTWPDTLKEMPTRASEVNLFRSPGHLQNWLDCIRNRQRPLCDVEVGARSVTVCHLANIASWVDRPIEWDPVKEVIVGDDEASRWLSRPKRAPYDLHRNGVTA